MTTRLDRIAPALALCEAFSAFARDSQHLSLKGNWQFALATTSTKAEALSGFHAPGYDTTRFRALPVPSNWALHGHEAATYKAFKGDESQGFYLTRFSAPASFTGQRVLLHFGGVWSSAEVWLNGKPLGRHDSGFTGFAHDVTHVLRPGAENTLGGERVPAVEGGSRLDVLRPVHPFTHTLNGTDRRDTRKKDRET
ncbi:sugar-binding domain-containing protein [Pelomonas margarita]|uniref:Sugar-binding domain-containing protein n=1 Tax=Pelomonas margarita TaxID=3299031 RepID=A0ABW7FES9_9BURK